MEFTIKEIAAYEGETVEIILKNGVKLKCIIGKVASGGKKVDVLEKAANPTFKCNWFILRSEIAAIGVETRKK